MVPIPSTTDPHGAGDLAAALRDHGMRHHNGGDYEAARSVYHRAVAVAPTETGTLHMLAMANWRLGRRAEAISILERIFTLGRLPYGLDENIGRLAFECESAGDFPAIARVGALAVRLYPDDLGYRGLHLKGILASGQDPTRAIAVARAHIAQLAHEGTDTGRIAVALSIAQTLIEFNRCEVMEDAVRLARRLVRLTGRVRSLDVHLRLTQLCHAGRFAGAAALLRRVNAALGAEERGADFWWRFWSLCEFDPAFFTSLEAGGDTAALPRLVPVVDAVPPGDGIRDPIIVFACDSRYLRLFGAGLLDSLRRAAHDPVVHIHLVDPDAPALAFLEAAAGRAPGRLGYSVQVRDPDWLDRAASDTAEVRTFYACARFLIVGELLRRYGRPLLVVDTDGVCVGDPLPLVTRLLHQGVDVAVMDGFFRDPPRQYCAQFVLFNPSDAGKRYAVLLSRYIQDRWRRGWAYWMLDQAALFCCARAVPGLITAMVGGATVRRHFVYGTEAKSEQAFASPSVDAKARLLQEVAARIPA